MADVTKAGEVMEATGERHWEPEIYRVRGEIDWLRSGGSAELAEAGFQRALDIARERQAKTWELRAAISLAKRWRAQAGVCQRHTTEFIACFERKIER